MRKHERGVTFVEIAIVLIVVSLLLGGVLKGQELITNAKVRALASRQNSLKVAWFAFIDRFEAMPGDFQFAGQYIPGAVSGHPGSGDGFIEISESPIVMQNLTGLGYLRCPQCTATIATAPSADNSLQNRYGGVMAIFYDSEYYEVQGGNQTPLLQIHTGARLPSNILAEVDRKFDDGVANTGGVVFSWWAAAGDLPLHGLCLSQSRSDHSNGRRGLSAAQWWRHAAAFPSVEDNCGASVNIFSELREE